MLLIMKPKLSFLLLALILASCNNQKARNKEDAIFNVSFDNCKTTIDLKLSDLVDSFKFVRLETTPESLIGNNPRIILAKDNIIVIDMNGIYKFTPDGHFVRKIINFGRGPEELSAVIDYYFYKSRGLLFIADRLQNKDRFQIFDIEKEIFLDPIKKCFPGPWGAFLVYNDSLIMGSMVAIRVDTNRYAMFIQNFKGDLITGIANSRKVLDARLNKETVQRLLFCQGENDIFSFYVYDDTLFRYTTKGLLPYLIVSYNSPRNYMRTMGFKIGESRVVFPSIDNSNFILLNESTYTGESQEGSMVRFNYNRNYYFLNKTDKSFSKVKSYTDDISGKIQECNGESLSFPVLIRGNSLYVLYYPNDLINSKLKDYESLSPEVSDQLQKIQEGLDVMDNPILLIGSIKKSIKID
jgi:hypothetical protein